MSPCATKTGPGVICQTITFDCGVTDTSCAATMYPFVEASAVFAGTGVKAGVPSEFFRTWVASAKCVAVTDPLQVVWPAGGFPIAQMSAVTKGSVGLLPS